MQDSKRDTDVQNNLLDSVGEGEGGMIWGNGIETCILSYVKQIASPGLMHDTGCLRNGMGREVVGGFMMGNTCTLEADSCQCMAKSLQYCNYPSIKINLY